MPGPLLRRNDQLVIGSMVFIGLLAMAANWLYHGGQRGGLVEIERATPLRATFVVDVNSAAWPELAQMPQIGEVLARRIVESRETDGLFRDEEQLLRVNGIGPRTLEQIRPYLLPIVDLSNVAASPAAGPQSDQSVQ